MFSCLCLLILLYFCLNNSVTVRRFTSEFEPLECLGRGAFGLVHKVRHKELKNEYAVKIVRYNEYVCCAMILAFSVACTVLMHVVTEPFLSVLQKSSSRGERIIRPPPP